MMCRICDELSTHRHQWGDLFGPSTYGTGVWIDRGKLGRTVMGVPGSIYIDSLRVGGWSAYAEGGLNWSVSSRSGKDEARSHRIYGWAAMRFLCHLSDVETPGRRLKGEPFRPDPGVLTVAVARQLAKGYPYQPKAPVRSGAVFDPELPFDHLGWSARSFWLGLHGAHLEYGIDPGVPDPPRF